MSSPDLDNIINTNALSGYSLELDEGVYRIIHESKLERLGKFLAAFEHNRQGHENYLVPVAHFPDLPFGPEGNKPVWQMRQNDLGIIQKLINKGGTKKILDMGSWNGWLSNWLSNEGHEVVAMDYFVHELYGLKAKKHYPNNWLSIQLDVHDLALFKCRFDLIVVNRCLAYLPEPEKRLRELIGLLNENGKILLTGLYLLGDERKHKAQSLQQQEKFYKKYGIELFFNPVNGYLTSKDKNWIEAAGFKLYKYPQHWKGNLKARFIPSSPFYYFAVYE